MSTDPNNNSVLTESQPALFPLDEHKTSNGIEPDNKAEVHKRTRTATAAEPVANRPQTRQLKEAGISTHSDKVVVASAPSKGQTPPTCDQTNKFKQANETPATKNFENDEIKDGKEADLEGEKTRESPSTVGLAKTRSHGQRTCTLRGRSLKNSTKDANGGNGTKSAENEADLLADEEIEDNNQSQSCPSFTGSTGDGAVGKRKSGSRPNQKSSRKCAYSKNKDEKSANEASEKSDSDGGRNLRRPRINSAKEEFCLEWISSLNEIKPSELNMEVDNSRTSKEAPEFCSNIICPISENKIQKSSKVLRQAKKVVLTKALFGGDDERWYCFKCLHAHNSSFFCFYCGQIYFEDEQELEDDQKAWICCDKCSKWIHLDCDIKKGKNVELQQNYNKKNYKYFCPECRNCSPRKRTKKAESFKNGKRTSGSKASFKRMKTENQSSGYSNANDNESQRAKNETFNDDANMAAGASQMGEDLREESFISRTDSMGKSCSKADGDAYANSASRKAEKRKLRANKRANAKNVNNRKRLKRTHEESSYSDYRNERDSLEEIMHYRSIKIIKEREEIVEGRNLGQKVSAFCGVTPTMLADRANETVRLIREAIERDCQANGNSKLTGNEPWNRK